jgi:hypothetical protein
VEEALQFPFCELVKLAAARGRLATRSSPVVTNRVNHLYRMTKDEWDMPLLPTCEGPS